MMSYYLEKGCNINELCNLSRNAKNFYKASMLFQIERQANKDREFLKILSGGING